MTPDHGKAAIITMVRRAEFPAAWSCLRTIDPQLGPNTRHFLLLNDASDAELETLLSQRPNTEVLTPGRNLGVAVGRNRLIAAALEWGADTVISLDDDLLVPSDFIDRLHSWITTQVAEGEAIGVVAPIVLDFHAVADKTMSAPDIAEAEQGRMASFMSTDMLRSQVRTAWPDDLPVEVMYHAGIRDWRNHYLDSYRGRASRIFTVIGNSRGVKDRGRLLTEMRLDPQTRQQVLAGDSSPIPINTAPGGACAYTADLLRAIGGIDEAFSPFGYEDSDFAIRALSAGFKNYTLPSEMLLHDLDSRKKERSPAILLYTQGRARALLGRKHLPRKDRMRVLTEVACLAPIQAMELSRATGGRRPSVAGEILGSAIAYLAGFAEGTFSEPSEPAFGDQIDPGRYVRVPTHLERNKTFKLRSWPQSPKAGLPRELPLDISFAYTWDKERSRFHLQRLIVDAPGLIRASLTAELEGVGRRDHLGNPDPLSTTLTGACLEICDWGFLKRFETTVAWFRQERSTGYLGPLLKSPNSGMARDFKWFLSLRNEPAELRITVDPPTPISVAELFEQTPGVNQNRRLGLTAMVKPTTRY